jgi:O-acetyl-ADP-ribose deacetylase (regulator of RNase III)
MALRLVREDLIKMDVEAIVNAANESLAMGGGVCGAIFRAAGAKEMAEACGAIGHCPTGGAVITPGFNLKARHVIHTVGPIWRGGGGGEPELLRSCYASCLELAAEKRLQSIAFPLISAGIFGYPRLEALAEAMRAVSAFQAARLESHGYEGPEVFITVVGDVSDLADPEFRGGPLPMPEDMRSEGVPDLLWALTESREFGKAARLAIRSNIKSERLVVLLRGPIPTKSEAHALAVGFGFSPGRAWKAFFPLGAVPPPETGWLLARHLEAPEPDINRLNRNLFALGLPILP